jgi:hypothetical protein
VFKISQTLKQMGCEERKAKGSLEVGLVGFTCSPTYLTDHYTWASGSCFPDRRYFGFNHAPPTKVVGRFQPCCLSIKLKEWAPNGGLHPTHSRATNGASWILRQQSTMDWSLELKWRRRKREWNFVVNGWGVALFIWF